MALGRCADLVFIMMLAFGPAAFAAAPESSPGGSSSSTRVMDPRCEYSVDFVGIDVVRPRLSWRRVAERRGAAQTACRIRVAESREDLETGDDLV